VQIHKQLNGICKLCISDLYLLYLVNSGIIGYGTIVDGVSILIELAIGMCI